MPRVIVPIMVRFMAKIKLAANGCWEWQGYRLYNGYGRFAVNRKIEYAHRVAYRWFKGEIPSDKEIDHICNVRHCVNPEHLRTLSHGDNFMRGNGPKRFIERYANRTHCDRGHPFSGSNLILRKDGSRRCRTCKTLSYQRCKK